MARRQIKATKGGISLDKAPGLTILDCRTNEVRRVAHGEMYRMMGFPDTFKPHPDPVERFKQLGNSIAVQVVEAITRELVTQGFVRKTSLSKP
jgi:hypothetical protein